MDLVAQSIITSFAGTDYIFTGNGQSAVNATLGNIPNVIVDQQGVVYFSDPQNHLVMKVGTDGILSVVAGSGAQGNTGDGGLAIHASLDQPGGLALDPVGNLYIADQTIIRLVTPAGIISTFAGTAAGFVIIRGLSTDSAGNLYAADFGGHRVFRITPNGTVNAIAGTGKPGFGGDGGQALQALLNSPAGVAVQASGEIFIADAGNNRIRRITPSGTITTMAGNGDGGYSGDGGALVNSLQDPTGVSFDSEGNLYIADSGNFRVRRVSPSGTMVTLAGSAPGFFGDGGPARDALLNLPVAVAPDQLGNIYIADYLNNRVRRILPAGFITTAAGNGLFDATGDGGPAIAATFGSIWALTIDASRNLYVADQAVSRIRKIDGNGTIATFAGNGVPLFSGDGGAATAASLDRPFGLAVDSSGNLLIADTDNNRIRKVSPSGLITTIAGGGAGQFQDGIPALGADLGEPTAILLDGAGDLYFNDNLNRRVRRISTNGTISTVAGGGTSQADTGPATGVALKGPESLAIDTSGNLYIGDVDRVRRVTPAGIISTIVGIGAQGFSGDGGPAIAAAISDPQGLLIDQKGTLYIADYGNNRVRNVTPNGIITTIAGNGSRSFFGDGGPATLASLFLPVGLAIDPDGNLYIADSGNQRIRRILATPPTFSAAPSTIAFFANAGGAAPPPQNLTLTAPFAGPPFALTVSTKDNGAWLFVNASTGQLPSSIQVTVDPTGLIAGTYQGTISISVSYASPPTRTVSVTLTVAPSQPPVAGADPSALSFSFVAGSNAASSQVRLTNRGGGLVNFNATVSAGAAWLSVSPGQGTATAALPSLLSVTADPESLPPGTYTGQILIHSPTEQQIVIPVTATVNAQQQTIVLSQTGLTFTSVMEGGSALPQTFGVINAGQGILEWTAEASTISGGADWLKVSPQSGTTDAASLIVPLVSVSVDATGLAAGTYYGQVVISSAAADNSPQTVTVILSVLPPGSDPGPLIRPTGLIFAAAAGGPNPSPQTFIITNLTAATLTFISGAISDGPANLFTYTPAVAAVVPNQPVRVTVQANVSGVPPGVYRGTLTFQFSTGAASTVNLLFLVVSLPPSSGSLSFSKTMPSANGCTPQTLYLVPTSLGYGFSVPASWPVALEVQVVDDCGQPLIQGSVVATFSNGDPALSLASLKDGRWSGTWLVQNSPSGPVTVTFTAGLPGTQLRGSIQVGGGAQPNPNPPVLGSGAIVSAASLGSQLPLAPGTLITIFGSRLSSQTSTASSLPLKTQLADTSVVIGGRNLPLLYASGQQINAVIPYGIPINTSLQMIIQRGGTYTTPQSIQLAAAQPGIFTFDQSGSGQGIIVDVNNRIVDVGNPAKAGDTVVIYCAGLGEVTPPVNDGAAAPTSPPSSVVNSVSVTIGGQPADVSFAGLVPGSVGLYQVNAVVPSRVPTSNATPVILSSSGQASRPVTIAIQ